ncbi:MAG: site-2 protease family protein, partial [bacterium]
PATLPYFIPAPTIIGTLGAVIRIKGAIWDRRALLDIGVAGPLAGFAVAFPALVVGFHLSRVVPVEQGGVHLILGDSLLVILMSKLVVGTVPEGMDVLLHPVGFAGWLGMFVTSLNLLPVWQLDGGHIVKALFPEHSDRIARVVHLALVVMGGLFWLGWLLLALLLVFVGVRHPPVLLPHIALNEGRRRAGYLALAVFILTFVPAPFQVF